MSAHGRRGVKSVVSDRHRVITCAASTSSNESLKLIGDTITMLITAAASADCHRDWYLNCVRYLMIRLISVTSHHRSQQAGINLVKKAGIKCLDICA